jgi:hypothetical protein
MSRKSLAFPHFLSLSLSLSLSLTTIITNALFLSSKK